MKDFSKLHHLEYKDDVSWLANIGCFPDAFVMNQWRINQWKQLFIFLLSQPFTTWMIHFKGDIRQKSLFDPVSHGTCNGFTFMWTILVSVLLSVCNDGDWRTQRKSGKKTLLWDLLSSWLACWPTWTQWIQEHLLAGYKQTNTPLLNISTISLVLCWTASK